MNIGIDIDDVIIDTYEIYFAYAQKYTIEELKKEPIIKDDGLLKTSCYATYMHNWTQEQEDVFWGKYARTILENANLKTFAKEIIERLRKEGNRIIIITAREGIEEEITYEYFKKVDLKADKVICGVKNKGKTAKENKIDIFVDDNYENCLETSKLGIKTYIMDIRSNRNIKDNNIERVYSWPHLYQKIKQSNINSKGGIKK